MKKRVVIENRLLDVKDYFADKGYDVRSMHHNETLNEIDTEQYDAIIVSNISNKSLSEEIKSSNKIVEAFGLVPHQVYEKMQTRINRHQ